MGFTNRGRCEARIAASLDRIVRGQRRAAAAQVLIRPLCGGSEGHDHPVTPIGLRGRIRAMLRSGHLPPLMSRRCWLGQGHGDICPLCTQPITPLQWEREVEAPPLGEVRVHGLCFRMWFEESAWVEKSA